MTLCWPLSAVIARANEGPEERPGEGPKERPGEGHGEGHNNGPKKGPKKGHGKRARKRDLWGARYRVCDQGAGRRAMARQGRGAQRQP